MCSRLERKVTCWSHTLELQVFFSGSLQMGDFVRGALVRRERVKGLWNNLRRSLASYSAHIATPPLCGTPPPPHAACLQRLEDQLKRPGVDVSVLINSSESHFCNRAQPSAALLLQLSLFLRHSSEAISLTRPAHFFFPLLPSPTPSAFSLLHSITLLLFLLHYLPCSSSI